MSKEKNKELKWCVYNSAMSTREIEKINIFKLNWVFNTRIAKVYKDLKKKAKKEGKSEEELFEEFKEGVKTALMVCYWGKCEYEVVVTNWPTRVDGDEIDRLAEEKASRIEKWGKFYGTSVKLENSRHIDIYEQVQMNWEQFIEYLWANRELIKKLEPKR